MDEKNDKLQPLQEALPPEAPAMQQAQEAAKAPQLPDAQTQEAAPAPEKESEAAAPEQQAQKQASAQEASKAEMASSAAAGYTRAFDPIRDTGRKVTDATIAIAAVKDIPQPSMRESTQTAPQKASEVSYFDGSTWAYIGWWALAALITVATLGVGLAWAQCMFWRYRAKHTVVCGRRLTFDGTGLQLFENYLIWGTLTVITLGIYSLWVPFKVRSWYCGHLYMTGYRRRHSPNSTPTWRNVLIFLTALLCFALILTGIIIVATGNAPWQEKKQPAPEPPPASSTMGETAPPTSPPTTPETTPEPTTTPVPTTPKPTTPAKKTYTVVNAPSGLTLRSTPSRDGNSLALIPNGTVVTEEDSSGEWVKVTYDGKTGWCNRGWLKENG